MIINSISSLSIDETLGRENEIPAEQLKALSTNRIGERKRSQGWELFLERAGILEEVVELAVLLQLLKGVVTADELATDLRSRIETYRGAFLNFLWEN